MAAKYWWFQGDSVTKLKEQLNAAEAPRLEIRIVGKDKMLLTVKDKLVHDPINESHVCPPVCP